MRARCAPGTLWPRAPERAGLGQPTQACEQIFALWASTAHKRRRPGIPIEGSRARQTPRLRYSLKGVVTEAAARVSVVFFFWCLQQWRRRATTRVCSCRGFLSMYGITQYHVIQDIDPCTVASGAQHPTSSQTLTHAQSRRYCARGSRARLSAALGDLW